MSDKIIKEKDLKLCKVCLGSPSIYFRGEDSAIYCEVGCRQIVGSNCYEFTRYGFAGTSFAGIINMRQEAMRNWNNDIRDN